MFKAALAVWRYCDDSAAHIVGDTPAAVLTPGRLREVVLAAESAGFHAATFSDAPHP